MIKKILSAALIASMAIVLFDVFTAAKPDAKPDKVSRWECVTPGGEHVALKVTGAAHLEVMGCNSVANVGRDG